MRLAAMLCLLVLSGCVATTQLAPADAAHVVRLTNGKSVVVRLVDGRSLRGRSLRIDADSASWVDPETGALERVATADITRVTRTRHWSGAVEGFGLGLVIGVPLGAALGALGSESCGEDPLYFCGRGWGAVGGGFGGLVTGPPLGLLIGAAVGRRERYVLAPPAR